MRYFREVLPEHTAARQAGLAQSLLDVENTVAAAKAIGLLVERAAFGRSSGEFLGVQIRQVLFPTPPGSSHLFAPLRHDGDADRLVDGLGLAVILGHDKVAVRYGHSPVIYLVVPFGDDRAAARRQAITKAAALVFAATPMYAAIERGGASPE